MSRVYTTKSVARNRFAEDSAPPAPKLDLQSAAISKLEEKYRRDAVLKAQKDKEKDERKRKERIEKYERMLPEGPGHLLGSPANQQPMNRAAAVNNTIDHAAARQAAIARFQEQYQRDAEAKAQK